MKLAGSKKRPAYLLYHLSWEAIDWLYPPHCASCGKQGARICRKCYQEIQTLNNKVCPICGHPYNLSKLALCPNCIENSPSYKALRSWGIYNGPLRDAIHQLKYKRDVGLGEELANKLIELLAKLSWSIDIIIPVPLSKNRLEERGYNQSFLLAYPLALAYQTPCKPRALRRTRNTLSQVGLKAPERLENVRGAFWADGNIVSGKNVLLIDDVTTTGATLQASALACNEANASNVFCLTIAQTNHPPNEGRNVVESKALSVPN